LEAASTLVVEARVVFLSLLAMVLGVRFLTSKVMVKLSVLTSLGISQSLGTGLVLSELIEGQPTSARVDALAI
jgi:hypothetical protein